MRPRIIPLGGTRATFPPGADMNAGARPRASVKVGRRPPRRRCLEGAGSRWREWVKSYLSKNIEHDSCRKMKMAVDGDTVEHMRVLSQVHKGIEGLRRRLQELQPELSTSESEVINTARQ